ncbi:HalOD1 output domain-containing protein [Natronococcus roseus]|uniref:HalOD1 output domain-containing protein n=1 Tax=Natronococcus roseus TaxID=1052014 RepID=UPI00374CFD36
MGTLDSGANAVHGQYDWSTSRPSIAVINAIAALENVEPTDISVALHNHIDPEALDALVATDSHITISFTRNEYRAWIDGDKLVITDD